MKKFLKKIATYIFHSNNIFVQLVVFTLIVSIVPVILISSLLFNRMSELVETTLDKSSAQLVVQYMNNINENFLRYQDRLQQITNNTIIIDELLNRTSDTNPYVKGKKVSAEISKCLRLDGYNEFRHCMIYSRKTDAKIYGSRVAMFEEATKEAWYLNKKLLKGEHLSYYTTAGKSRILSLLADINYIDTNAFTKEYLGFVKLDLDADKLFEPVAEKEEHYPYDVIVLDQENELVYSSDEGLMSLLDEVPFEKLSSSERFQYKNTMIYGDEVSYYNLKIIFLFQDELFMKRQQELQKSIIPIVLLFVGFIGITGYLFTRSFSIRVGQLVKKIKIAEEGDLTVTEEIGGNDEIALLDKQFNRMLKRLDALIQKNYIQQLEKKEAELRNLHLQINPHFLYNTLETISALAAVKGLFNICDLCEKLGEIFRYSLGKDHGEYVSIEEEFKHIKNYIFIQEARFGDKFNVEYNIQSELMKCKMLRFILQPIIENAIVHGLSKRDTKGNLIITFKREQDDLIIKIEDNGVGMTPENLERLNEYIHYSDKNLKNKTKSIGIKNVDNRIKLACGIDYGIQIDSKLNEGSYFTIRLPFIE